MKIAAGVVARHPFITDVPDTTLIQFTISADRLSDTEIMDSAASPAGRYVGELLRRLRRLAPGADAYLVFNPMLEVPYAGLHRVLLWARRAAEEEAVFWLFTDGRGRALAYMLRADAVDACPPVHLGLLAMDQPALDERFLRASCGPGRLVAVRGVLGVQERANGFQAHSPALRELTLHATHLLESQPSEEARRRLVREGGRAALIGYHAGDVLFVLQALTVEETRFQAVVVPPDYADIVRQLRPDLLGLVVRQPVPMRGAYQISDDVKVYADYVRQLALQGEPTGFFFHPLRGTFRDYSATRHHLREATAFAVGGAGHRLRPVVPLPPGGLREHPLMVPDPRRVVVQYDAGWELKGYPLDRRGELLDLLIDAGYEPLLLGRPEPSHPQVPAIAYSGLAAFRALLGSATAFIGCDSFPTHFSDVVGVPTVTLFGSTKPDNSRGLESRSYRFLQQDMPCVPCGQRSVCPLDRGQSCRAHVSAGQVLVALQSMLGARPRPAPRPLEEVDRLAREVAPRFTLPSSPPLDPDAEDRCLRELLARCQLERVEACPFCGSSELRLVGVRSHLPVAECGGCGLWLAQERVAARELPALCSERRWSDLMRSQGRPTHLERYLHDYFAALERVRDLAPLLPAGAAVLDVGCALAAFPRRLRESGFRGAGLELDAGLRQEARLYSGVEVYGSLEEAAGEGLRFEAVTLFDFARLRDPVAYLKALRGCMADRGVVLLEAVRTDSAAFQREGLLHEAVRPIERPFLYRQHHLEELLRRAGLTPLWSRYPDGSEGARLRIAASWEPA